MANEPTNKEIILEEINAVLKRFADETYPIELDIREINVCEECLRLVRDLTMQNLK